MNFVLGHNADRVRDAGNHKAKLSALLTYIDDLREMLAKLPASDPLALDPLKLLVGEIDRLLAHRKSEVLKPSEGTKVPV
ncbi:hypothetical protein D3Y57_14240 [Sphingomonas paeninsulae]|uniref:Uncharacterized protein n=1 Tax=Sphingomonas paeninsulae TaxID=2319844 RepID=A0A494TBV1_SPHPE|nr:hypothetical protein D3Y57_14240 [Sphingomonas paeninsulae]